MIGSLVLRRASFGLLLAGACTRAPADARSPGTDVEASSISSECKSAELSLCVESCRDLACIEWCAGESCADTLTTVLSCTADVPAHERWIEACQPICSAQVVPPPVGPSFCDDWRTSYYAMARLSQPLVPNAEASTDDASLATLDSIVFATSMWLVGEVARRYDDPHLPALEDMIHGGGWPLGDIESCVPDLDARGREFFIALELDLEGAARATHVRGDPTGGGCVADAVASALTLPARVARDYPQIEVRVLVKPPPDTED